MKACLSVLAISLLLTQAASASHYLSFTPQEEALVRTSHSKNPYVVLDDEVMHLLRVIAHVRGVTPSASLERCIRSAQSDIRLVRLNTLVAAVDEVKGHLNRFVSMPDTHELSRSYLTFLDELFVHLRMMTTSLQGKDYELGICQGVCLEQFTRGVHHVKISLLRPYQKTTKIGKLVVSNDLTVNGDTSVLKEVHALEIATPEGEGDLQIEGNLEFDLGQILELATATIGTIHHLGRETISALADQETRIVRITFANGEYPDEGIYFKFLVLGKEQGRSTSSFVNRALFFDEAQNVTPVEHAVSGTSTIVIGDGTTFNADLGSLDIELKMISDVSGGPSLEQASLFYKAIGKNIESIVLVNDEKE